MFSRAVIESFKAHAISCFPNEACGLVVEQDGAVSYLRCNNLHEEPRTNFKISGDVYVAAKEAGEVHAILHTHTPNMVMCKDGKEREHIAPEPSKADVQLQLDWDIPVGLALCTSAESCGDPYYFGDFRPITDLVGREYLYNVSDCFTLVRDYYRTREVNPFTIPIVATENDWWDEGVDLYEQHWAKAGFRQVQPHEVKEGDAFIMRIRAKVPNHAGVYLGKNLILHHLYNQLSIREPLTKFQPFVTKWLRHEKDF